MRSSPHDGGFELRRLQRDLLVLLDERDRRVGGERQRLVAAHLGREALDAAGEAMLDVRVDVLRELGDLRVGLAAALVFVVEDHDVALRDGVRSAFAEDLAVVGEGRAGCHQEARGSRNGRASKGGTRHVLDSFDGESQLRTSGALAARMTMRPARLPATVTVMVVPALKAEYSSSAARFNRAAAAREGHRRAQHRRALAVTRDLHARALGHAHDLRPDQPGAGGVLTVGADGDPPRLLGLAGGRARFVGDGDREGGGGRVARLVGGRAGDLRGAARELRARARRAAGLRVRVRVVLDAQRVVHADARQRVLERRSACPAGRRARAGSCPPRRRRRCRR